MIIGYKATYNFKCLDQVYEIGQEYKLDHKPEMCVSGFHYCLNAIQTIRYYPINKEFKLLEIEDLSSDTITDGNKSCSNHIKIIREITEPDELMNLLGRNFSYNESTKSLKVNYSDDFWYEYTYNEAGQKLTYKESSGYIRNYKYDEYGYELT